MGEGDSVKTTDLFGFADLSMLELGLRVGTVVEAGANPRASRPAFVLTIDFGPLGTRTSSAQITENYQLDTIVGRQVVAVTNLPPKRVAGVRSEVLVLAAVSPSYGPVLLELGRPVENGTVVA